MDRFGDNHLRFENLVNYDKSKTVMECYELGFSFENLVNYDKSKTQSISVILYSLFENLVNYDKSKTLSTQARPINSLRTL